MDTDNQSDKIWDVIKWINKGNEVCIIQYSTPELYQANRLNNGEYQIRRTISQDHETFLTASFNGTGEGEGLTFTLINGLYDCINDE